ncbi:hypothetical protein NXV12_31280 [Bacteroides thetaiotaomicron]|nr:hypothetical protein [Bacteroides thetaiotaomicron]
MKRFNTETFLADRSELLEFLHGGFLLDYYYPLPYGCCFSLHLLPNRIRNISVSHSPADGRCYLQPSFHSND